MRGRTRPEPAELLTAAESERLAIGAVDREDAAAMASLESRLTTLHHKVFPRAQRTAVAPARELGVEDALDSRDAAAAAGMQHRRERRDARSPRNRAKGAADSASVKAFLAAGRVAARVREGYAEAASDSTWRGIEAHDPTAVIAALEGSFAETASDCVCVDAGRAGRDRRAYVTVIVRVPGPEVVPDRGPGAAATGRPMLRRRTPEQREQIYRAMLASATLATVNHVLGAAVSTDDVNVVLVRPSLPSASDLVATGERPPRLAALHVARLSREEVTLRPVDADPLALVFGSSPEEDTEHLLEAKEPPSDGPASVRGSELTELVEALNDLLVRAHG